MRVRTEQGVETVTQTRQGMMLVRRNAAASSRRAAARFPNRERLDAFLSRVRQPRRAARGRRPMNKGALAAAIGSRWLVSWAFIADDAAAWCRMTTEGGAQVGRRALRRSKARRSNGRTPASPTRSTRAAHVWMELDRRTSRRPSMPRSPLGPTRIAAGFETPNLDLQAPAQRRPASARSSTAPATSTPSRFSTPGRTPAPRPTSPGTTATRSPSRSSGTTRPPARSSTPT